MGLLQHAIQNNMETTAQILGVGVTLGLCFIGIANLTWVKIISLYTAVLTLTQNILLQQHAVTAMYTINIAYYLIVLFEDKYPTLKTPALKYGAPTLAIATAAATNYILLQQPIASPATLAIFGATTGLLMVKAHKYLILKALTATNAIIWSSYCITIGAYTNIVGNIVILIGVLITTAHYLKSTRQGNLI